MNPHTGSNLKNLKIRRVSFEENVEATIIIGCRHWSVPMDVISQSEVFNAGVPIR